MRIQVEFDTEQEYVHATRGDYDRFVQNREIGIASYSVNSTFNPQGRRTMEVHLRLVFPREQGQSMMVELPPEPPRDPPPEPREGAAGLGTGLDPDRWNAILGEGGQP